MKKIISFSLAIIMLLIVPLQEVYASTLSSSALNIYPLVDNRQVGKATNFFNMNTNKGATETLKFEAINSSNKDINLTVLQGNALSIVNGGVHLSPETKTETSYFLNNEFEMKSWIKVTDKVVIPAKSKVEIPVEVKIPDTIDNGTYIGGVIFEQKSDGTASPIGTKGQATVKINNNFNYEFAIQLNVGEFKTQYDSSKLKIKNVKVDSLTNELTFIGENYHNYLLNLSNLSYVVTDENENEVYQGKINNLKFSPMTSGTYKLQLGEVKFKKGKYNLQIINSKKEEINSGSFVLKDKVIIKKEVEKKQVIQNDTQKKNETNITLMIVILIICCIVSIAIGIFVGRKSKKNINKENLDENDK